MTTTALLTNPPLLGHDDLLVVADPADPVAAEFANYLGEHGHRAVVLDPFAAAQLFTVEVTGPSHADPGGPVAVRVDPCVPMLLRLPEMAGTAGYEARFQYAECLAQLWSAAALTDAPVVNRPGYRSLGGAVSESAALTALRAGEPAGSVEVFASAYPDPAARAGERWWVRDAATGASATWPTRPAGDGPYRARWSAADPLLEAVVVLGADAWRATTADLDHLRLEARSTAAAAALGLTLAAVIWRVDEDGGHAHLVDVDAFPGLEVLRTAWLGLGPALLRFLFHHPTARQEDPR